MRLLQKVLNNFEKFNKRVSAFGLISGGFVILLIGFIITYGVVRRYGLNSPEPYSYEISTIFLVYVATISIQAVQHSHSNIRIDIIPMHFPRVMRIIVLEIVGSILGIFFVSVVTWQAWKAGFESYSVSEISSSIWAQPVWPVKLLIPIGWSLLTLELLSELFQGIFTLFKGPVKKD